VVDACNEPTDAAGKSVSILCDNFAEAIRVEDLELTHCHFPIVGCATTFWVDIAQRQPNQLGGRLIAGEVTTRLDDFAQPGADTFDIVG